MTFATRCGRGFSPQPHAPAASTPRKDQTPIAQDAVWAPGPVCSDGKSRPHQDSIPNSPSLSQSLYRLNYPAHTTKFNNAKFYAVPTPLIYVFCVDFKKKATSTLYSLKLSVSITDIYCVYCVVRTASLYKTDTFVFKEFRNIQCWLFIMGTGCENSSLQGRYAKSTGKKLQTFRRDVFLRPQFSDFWVLWKKAVRFLELCVTFNWSKLRKFPRDWTSTTLIQEPQTATWVCPVSCTSWKVL